MQRNHLHLLVEAEDKHALRRGLVGLQVRLAKAINRIARRAGRVFVDRYHAEVLSTPRQVRNALVYVLNNAKKHARQVGRTLPAGWVDPCSTARSFFVDGRGLQAARTWLLGVGWKKRGRIAPDHVPKAA